MYQWNEIIFTKELYCDIITENHTKTRIFPMLWLGKFLPASRKLADYEVLFWDRFFCLS